MNGCVTLASGRMMNRDEKSRVRKRRPLALSAKTFFEEEARSMRAGFFFRSGKET